MIAAAFGSALGAQAPEPAAAMRQRFTREISMRLDVPPVARESYARDLQHALKDAGLDALPPQYVLLVDRSPAVQAAFVYWLAPANLPYLVGAAPVSTGRPGTYEHLRTPVGVFAHALSNMDFRAEGTFNELGIRGYGLKGMRVFDFGWIEAERGWGPPGKSMMRLQVHATDPDTLEKQLGRARSKGCIRIPAALNTFLDRYGILDADYEVAAKQGMHLWVLRPDREPVASPGRYLVVVDSQRTARPAWPPWPPKRRQRAN